MKTVQDSLRDLQSRISAEPGLLAELQQALRAGGLEAAVDVARDKGIDVPHQWREEADTLSDLELELVTAGKNLGQGFGALGAGLGQIGAATGQGLGRALFGG